jgi:membrane-associated phospholipid phosphatase
VAGILLLLVAAAGLYFMVQPGPTPVDRVVLDVVAGRHHSAFLVAVSRLASPVVVGTVSVAAAALSVRRDHARSLAVLVGPALAVLACDWIVKPLVGRTFRGVLSFPSGTVAAVAALAMAIVLVMPDSWRWGAAAFGGVVTALVGTSVVALGWHYPTDAVAGVAMGTGVVLLADGAARGARLRARRRRGAHSGPPVASPARPG